MMAWKAAEIQLPFFVAPCNYTQIVLYLTFIKHSVHVRK